MRDIDDGKAKECIYCEIGKDHITLKDGVIKYTKEECKRDYQKFLRELADKNSVSEILKKPQMKGE